MTRMGRPNDSQPDGARDAAPGTRTWSKPVLVEYGHLAKLTRGPSGTQSEPTNFKKAPTMCL